MITLKYIVLITYLLLFLPITGCNKITVINESAIPEFTTFRDVPGITEEEIKAIEALHERYDSFVFGMIHTTEAYDYHGKEAQTRMPLFFGFSVMLTLVLILLIILFQKKLRERYQLETIVEKRTTEFNKSQNELKAALEAAEAANRLKSTFLANMSHEIRTPINSIVGFSELALDDEIPNRTREYLGKIKSSTEWLTQIINNILDISKIESGKLELEKIPFDMHNLFTDCQTLIMPKAFEKGILLHFYVEPIIDKVPLGDPVKLQHVFINLLSNAVKFTNTGNIDLFVKVKEYSKNTVTVYFEVKDTGIGMTYEQINKVFEPFVQAETGTTRKYGGTGLGLPIAQRTVEMMGGKLFVESSPSLGSKFYFTVEFDVIDASEADMPEKQLAFEVEKPLFKGEILLCEDNLMNQEVICEHLKRIGLKSVVAENGLIAVEMVQRRKNKRIKQFDLIFMDMHMPVMDGLEASSKILELETGIPIIAMTANIMASDRQIYKMSGMLDCVGKPFTSQELWQCLLKFLTPLNKVTENDSQSENENQPDTDSEFKKSLQKMFVKNNHSKFEEIITALKINDIKLAHRLAHTLKSNAGQIGNNNLQKAASVIETLLKNEVNMTTEEHLTHLKNELDIVLHNFSEEQEEDDLELIMPHQDEKQIMELITELEHLLKNGNPECINLVKDLRAIDVGNELGCKELVRQLVRQIEDFEFDNAYSTLGGLKRQFLGEL